MSRPTGESRRLVGLSRAVIALFVLAALSQARVQVFQRNSILEKASSSNRFEVTEIERAKRGKIFTSDIKPLAQDAETYELTVDFRRAPQSRAFFMDLGAAAGLPASDFEQLADRGVKRRSWRRPLSTAQADAVKTVKREWRVDGVSADQTGRRTYGLAEAASGIVGSMRDGIPQSGLEFSLNGVLKGKDGQKTGLVDRSGAFLPMRQSPGATEASDGASVVLTIDSQLQSAATAAIRTAVEANKADRGVAIVMDPHTGEILAMANWPAFDPNSELRPKNTRYSPDLDPAYQCALEPGSTFKILTLAKALDKGVVHPGDRIQCKGALKFGPWPPVRCDAHHGSRAHGLLDPQGAIAKSCNVCAATWALRIGYPDMVHYMEALGLFQETGIGLPYEVKGNFNYKEYAKQLQLATVGFGQSVTATPIGLAAAFCMLANGGVRMQPRLIAKIDEKAVPIGESKRVVSRAAADRVLGYMEAVIESDAGTGAKLRIPGYRLAGKTGTAQKVNNRKGPREYVSNFVGFVPMPKPRAMILVMVDNPQGGLYYGATVAGPVFVDLAKAVIHRYGIPRSSEVSAGQPTQPVQPKPAPKK